MLKSVRYRMQCPIGDCRHRKQVSITCSFHLSEYVVTNTELLKINIFCLQGAKHFYLDLFLPRFGDFSTNIALLNYVCFIHIAHNVYSAGGIF